VAQGIGPELKPQYHKKKKKKSKNRMKHEQNSPPRTCGNPSTQTFSEWVFQESRDKGPKRNFLKK
jgi:hypothetical protein